MRGSATMLNASANAASPAACQGVSTRSRSANSPDPTWTYCLASSACIADRRNRRLQAVGKRRYRVAELADRLGAVERPVVPEDLDGAACDERRAAKHQYAELFGCAERTRDRKRNARRGPAAGDLLHDLEHATLGRILAAEDVAPADSSALQRCAVSRRHVVHVRVRPRMLRTDESRQAPAQMIGNQAAHEVTFGERAGSVHDARKLGRAS